MAERLEKQLEFPFMKEIKISDLVINYICSQQKPQQIDFPFMKYGKNYAKKEAERIGEALILIGTYFFVGTALLSNKLRSYMNQR